MIRRLPRRAFRAAAVAALCLAPTLVSANCSAQRVDLRGEGLRQSFIVEVADDAAERAQGLMNRESMDLDRGMLFVYESPRRASFWMENTLIPLDMIFIDPRGVVTHVHPDAVPLDRSPISGGEGVQFVLEINAGLSAQLGIVPGVEIRHPAIAEAAGGQAAWPCD